MTLYQKILQLGLPTEDIDHHCSDLYVRRTPAVTKLLKEHFGDDPRKMPTTFKSLTNPVGSVWYDIPFVYDPFWAERGCC